jgi:hypothetical protein
MRFRLLCIFAAATCGNLLCAFGMMPHDATSCRIIPHLAASSYWSGSYDSHTAFRDAASCRIMPHISIVDTYDIHVYCELQHTPHQRSYHAESFPILPHHVSS